MTKVLSPPLSKSDAMRALVVAHLTGQPLSLDVEARGTPNDVRVLDRGLRALAGRTFPAGLDCEDGGAPFRFLLALAATTPGAQVRLFGSERLAARPHGALIDCLRTALEPQGLKVSGAETVWPYSLEAPLSLRSTPTFKVRPEDSGQFLSAALFAASSVALRRQQPCTVHVVGPVASEGYVALTERWLRAGGFQLSTEGASITVVAPAQPPTAPLPPIPGDWSALTGLLLIAWAKGAGVSGVDDSALHPDRQFLDVLLSCGLTTSADSGVTRLTGTLARGFDVNVQAFPDAALNLVALACVAPTPSTLRAVAGLRHKESDRLEGAQALATAGGATSRLDGDVLTVTPGARPARVAFDGQNDHRRVMAAAALAALTGATLHVTGTRAVDKSFPGFFAEIAAVGVVPEDPKA